MTVVFHNRQTRQLLRVEKTGQRQILGCIFNIVLLKFLLSSGGKLGRHNKRLSIWVVDVYLRLHGCSATVQDTVSVLVSLESLQKLKDILITDSISA